MGEPPTPRKARTGELTPPGMCFWARSKRVSEWVMCVGPLVLSSEFFLQATASGEELNKFPGPLRHIGRGKQTGNDRHDVGARSAQGRGVLKGNAADGNNRQADLPLCVLDQAERWHRRIGLDAGGEKTAKGDVARPLCLRF